MPEPRKIEVEVAGRKVIVKEVKFGDFIHAIEKATDTVIVAGEPKQLINRSKLLWELLRYSVEGMTGEEIKNLPLSEANKLLDAVVKVNPLAGTMTE